MWLKIGSFLVFICILILIKNKAWATIIKGIPFFVLAAFIIGIIFSSLFDFVEIVYKNMV